MNNSKSLTNESVNQILFLSSVNPSTASTAKIMNEPRSQQKLSITTRNHSLSESTAFRKVNSMRKSLVESKENLRQSQCFDKQRTNTAHLLAMLSERVAKLEEKELKERLSEFGSKQPSSETAFSSSILKLIEGTAASVATKYSAEI